MKTPPATATIRAREDLSPSLARFQLELEGGVPDFEAGQFLTIGLPHPDKEGRILWRPYSIASPPEEKDYLELYIRLAQYPVPGKFPSILWPLQVGDTLSFRPPKGAFCIQKSNAAGRAEQRRLVFLAGGTGVAPFRSMIGHLHATGSTREIILCHGVSYVQDLGYRQEFENLAAASEADHHQNWNFYYLPTISRPQEEANAGWEGHCGRVESLIQPGENGWNTMERTVGEWFTPENTSFYICGFDGIVKRVCQTVQERGFVTRKEAREDGSYDICYESYG